MRTNSVCRRVHCRPT